MVRDYQEDPRSQFHRTSQWPPTVEPVHEGGGQYLDAAGRPRPVMTIDQALQEHCRIPTKAFFLVSVDETGHIRQFTGPDGIHNNDIPKFFDQRAYIHVIRNLVPVMTPIREEPIPPYDGYNYASAGTPYADRRSTGRRQIKPDYDDEPPYYQTRPRKRPKGSSNMIRRDFDDDDVPVLVNPPKKQLRIGDADEVKKFYEQRFKNCQQTACKLIAKAWVKAVEPKKQSNHPYTGSDEKAPEWWPKPWGPTRDEKVRHKEPDHLYKKERVHLLWHILNMVVQPNDTQHINIQNLNLNISKLEEVTMDALSSFFGDKENKSNANKRPYLKEIFKVAKQQEKFLRGEIDAETIIHVMGDDKAPDSYQSDNEDASIKEDSVPNSAISGPPTLLNPSNSPHGLISTTSNASTDHSPAGPLQGGPFVSDLPVRQAQYALPVMGTEHNGYTEGGGGGGGDGMHSSHGLPLPSHGNPLAMPEILPPQHEAARRASLQQVYNSPQEYTNHPPYANTWGQQTTTTAPPGPSMYANTYPQQQQHQQQHHAPLPPPPQQHYPLPPSQPYMGGSFDGMHRYDSGQGALYRQQHPVPSPGGYEYLSHDHRVLPGPHLKLDPMGRNALH